VISDRTAAVNALKSGEINAGSVEVTQADTLRSAGFHVKHVAATAAGNLVLADRAGEVLKPLADVQVRKAINMAFDREKIVKQILQGSGKPTEQILNPKGRGHDAALDQTYSYDPAAAKKLLTEAGYPDGFPVTMPSLVFTKPFEATITQSLADIGIKVKWQTVPPQQNVSALNSKKYPILFFLEGLNTDPTMTQINFAPGGARNVFGSTDPQLTKLMDRAASETDPAKAADIYRQINSFTVKNAWNAPVFYIGTYWATKKGITYLGDGSSTVSTIRQFGVSG
jgi:peptide/nickel transport system substrate-binding protein